MMGKWMGGWMKKVSAHSCCSGQKKKGGEKIKGRQILHSSPKEGAIELSSPG